MWAFPASVTTYTAFCQTNPTVPSPVPYWVSLLLRLVLVPRNIFSKVSLNILYVASFLNHV